MQDGSGVRDIPQEYICAISNTIMTHFIEHFLISREYRMLKVMGISKKKAAA